MQILLQTAALSVISGLTLPAAPARAHSTTACIGSGCSTDAQESFCLAAAQETNALAREYDSYAGEQHITDHQHQQPSTRLQVTCIIFMTAKRLLTKSGPCTIPRSMRQCSSASMTQHVLVAFTAAE